MKTTRHFSALFLVLCLILSTMSPAFAAELPDAEPVESCVSDTEINSAEEISSAETDKQSDVVDEPVYDDSSVENESDTASSCESDPSVPSDGTETAPAENTESTHAEKAPSQNTVSQQVESAAAAADSNIVIQGSCGEKATYILYKDGRMVISGTGKMTISPSSKVESLATKLIIEEGITSIPTEAFSKCGKLTSAVIADSVERIGEFAFSNCKKLKTVKISDKTSSLRSIDACAFKGCSRLTSMVFPAKLKTIGGTAFSDCTNLSDIRFSGNALREIPDFCFYNCTKLVSINIPKGVASIGGSSFKNCSSLRKVTIPEGVKTLDANAFYQCSSLQSVSLPDSITKVGGSVFHSCSSLKNAKLSNNLTSLPNGIFQSCSALESIIIPDRVKNIENGAFLECSSLKTAVIPDSVTSMGNGVFNQCSSLSEISLPDGITEIRPFSFYYCSSLTKVKLPKKIVTLGEEAFYGCDNLKHIDLPDSLINFEFYCLPDSILPDAPSIKVSTHGTYYIKTAWHAVPYASQYDIYRSDSYNGEFTKIGSTKDTYYYDKTVDAGKTYYYYAKAKEINGNMDLFSDCSNVVHGTAIPRTPSLKLYSHGTYYVKTDWNDIPSASYYMVYRSTSPDSGFEYLDSPKDSCYTDKSVSAGQTYYYRVTAVGNVNGTKYVSDYSNTVDGKAIPRTPSVKLHSYSINYIKTDWKDIPSASYYRVYRSASADGKFEHIGSTSNSYFTDKTVSAGKTYYYRVTAVCKSGGKRYAGSYSNVVSGKAVPRTPSVKLHSHSTSYIKTDWNDIPSASYYRIYRASSSGGKFEYLDSTSNSYFTDKTVRSGKTYCYRVRAVGKVDGKKYVSGYSKTVSGTAVK